jgi:hypothetical protein
MNEYITWIGTGVEGGGTLFVPGVEYVAGGLFNLGMLEEYHDFQILNIRMGLGLGAGVGAVACFVFNCLNLWELNDTNVDDWSFDVNLSLGGKWSSLIKSFKGRKLIPVLRLLGNKGVKLTPDQVSTIRDFMSAFYSAYEIDKATGPKLISVEIPAAGVGFEVSAHFNLGGKIEILN